MPRGRTSRSVIFSWPGKYTGSATQAADVKHPAQAGLQGLGMIALRLPRPRAAYLLIPIVVIFFGPMTWPWIMMQGRSGPGNYSLIDKTGSTAVSAGGFSKERCEEIVQMYTGTDPGIGLNLKCINTAIH
jgi:hypothetical protein